METDRRTLISLAGISGIAAACEEETPRSHDGNARSGSRDLAISAFSGADPSGRGDSTAAILAAIAAAATTGRPLHVDGVYRFTARIVVTGATTLVGSGHVSDLSSRGRSCLLKDFDSGSDAAVVLAAADCVARNIHFDSIPGRSGDLLQMGADRQMVENCTFTRAGRDGLRIGSDAEGGNANLWRASGVYCFKNGRHGIYINDPTGSPDANAGTLIGADCRLNKGDGICHGTGLWNTIISPACQENGGTGIRLTDNAKACIVIGGDIEANEGAHQALIEAGARGNRIDAPLVGTGKWTNLSPAGTNKVSYYDSGLGRSIDGDLVGIANPRPGGEAVLALYADQGLDLVGQMRARRRSGSGGGIDFYTKPDGNDPLRAVSITESQNVEFHAGRIDKAMNVAYRPLMHITPLAYSWAIIAITNAKPYSVRVDPKGAALGQVIRITVRNQTRAAIGEGSWSPVGLSGSVSPGAGKVITLDLRFDGTRYLEISRSSEVPL